MAQCPDALLKQAALADTLNTATWNLLKRLGRGSPDARRFFVRGLRHAGSYGWRLSRGLAGGVERLGDTVVQNKARATALGAPAVFGAMALPRLAEKNMNNISPENPYLY